MLKIQCLFGQWFLLNFFFILSPLWGQNIYFFHWMDILIITANKTVSFIHQFIHSISKFLIKYQSCLVTGVIALNKVEFSPFHYSLSNGKILNKNLDYENCSNRGNHDAVGLCCFGESKKFYKDRFEQIVCWRVTVFHILLL